MISCKEAKLICDKTQYGIVSYRGTVELKRHLLYCESCTDYSNKNAKLTELCRKATVQTLSDSEKERMKNKWDAYCSLLLNQT